MTQRTLAAMKVALLVVALAATVAVGAERVGPRQTLPGALAPNGFEVSGKLASPLRPGVARALDLTLTNRQARALEVLNVSVEITVDAVDRRAGCSRLSYRQRVIPKRFFPLRLPARSTRTLRQLGVPVSRQIAMLNLPTNQDACQGARLHLRFGGYARPHDAARAR